MAESKEEIEERQRKERKELQGERKKQIDNVKIFIWMFPMYICII